MSDTYTAALIGGPKAGEVLAVADTGPVSVMVLPDDLYSVNFEPHKPLIPEQVLYERRTLSFFGKPMHFWCAPEFMGDPTNEAIARVAAHILSPLGMTLLKEGQR